MKLALWARFCERLLLTVQVECLVLHVTATGADAKQARALELEVGDNILHNGALRRPRLSVLVIDRHVPVLERLLAGPEAHFVEPGRIVRMDPPCQMQEARQRLQMAPHIREQHLELLVAVGARKSHTLHALVNCHGMTPLGGGAAAALSAAHSAVRPASALVVPAAENLPRLPHADKMIQSRGSPGCTACPASAPV